MHVKNFEAATKAIDDIVFNAKIPIHSMVAILETKKFELLKSHTDYADKKEAEKYFEALQKKGEKQNANKGVS